MHCVRCEGGRIASASGAKECSVILTKTKIQVSSLTHRTNRSAPIAGKCFRAMRTCAASAVPRCASPALRWAAASAGDTDMSEAGAVFYRGPSLLTGDPIVAIATGLDGGSRNLKTGPLVQTWIIRPELPPQDAKRQNLDDAICGDCRHRGDRGAGSTCY